MKIGDTHTTEVTFSQADFDRFAALSGDDNPIHVDPDFAARTKFGKTVAHGMLLYSTLIQILGDVFPGPSTRQLSQQLMFPSPTFVREKLRVELEVTARPAPRTAEISTDIFRPSGEMGCTGKTWVALPGFAPEDINLSKSEVPSPFPEQQNEIQFHQGLTLGQTASHTYTITAGDHRAYLELLDEQNPLYTDNDYAKRIGFRGRQLTGGQLGGMTSHLLGTRLPGRGTNWLKQHFTFIKPAYPEEPITGRVRIIRLRPAKDLVNLITRHENQAGELLVSGEALVWTSDLERTSDAQD